MVSGKGLSCILLKELVYGVWMEIVSCPWKKIVSFQVWKLFLSWDGNSLKLERKIVSFLVRKWFLSRDGSYLCYSISGVLFRSMLASSSFFMYSMS